MVATLRGKAGETAKKAKQYAAVFFDTINAQAKEGCNAITEKFHVGAVENDSSHIVELQVTWHEIMHYWATSAIFDHVYTLKPGFVFIDVVTNAQVSRSVMFPEVDLDKADGEPGTL